MKPLGGIRVVEAAAFIAGPFATMILADLGADVVKIEPPSGEPYRRLGRLYGDSSLLYRGVNQNKDGVALDLKSGAGVAKMMELLADADVFLSNWRPGVAESFGLTADAVREQFPKLIWVRVSGYGQDGPKATEPAYDMVIHARSGAMLSVPEAERPYDANSNVADKVTAMSAAQAAMAALLERNRTGEGTICDVSMVDANAYFYGADISAGHRVPDAEPDPYPAVSNVGRTIVETGDGWIALVPVTGKQLRSVLKVIDRLDDWERIKAAGSELIWPLMLELLEPELLTAGAEEWAVRFTEADVPVTAVKDFPAHFADEQVAHNRTYAEVTDPGTGRFLQVRFPARFDGEPVELERRPAPTLNTYD